MYFVWVRFRACFGFISQRATLAHVKLLTFVELLKEFKGMLWGQTMKVYTDHKNFMQKALGYTSDRVYRWRLARRVWSQHSEDKRCT